MRAPLLAFFGTGRGWNAYRSLPFAVSEDGTLTCRFAMPFAKRAVLTITHAGPGLTVAGQVTIDAASFGPDTLVFHAGWHPREVLGTRPFRDWHIGTLEGTGHQVGTMLDVENPPSAAWWGEGDEKITVDGEPFPSLFGTGTEDYFGFAWSTPEVFAHAYHAQTRAPGTGGGFGGFFSMNRFHVVDPIPFARSLRFDLELWHWSETSIAADALLYWYARPGDATTFRPAAPTDPTGAFFLPDRGGSCCLCPRGDAMPSEDVPGATPQAVRYFSEAERLVRAGSWALRLPSRQFVHWSPEQYRLHGLDPRGGVPSWQDVQQQIHPEDRGRCIEEMERALHEGGDWSLEYRCLLPDGAIKVIQSIAHPMAATDGQGVELVGADIDITNRKRVEEALRESEDRFRTFVDHAADAFFLHDTDNFGRILDVNRQACESLGYSREELIGRHPMDFDAELSFDQVVGFAGRVTAGETFVFESRHRRRDGTVFPVEIRIRPFQHGGRQMSVSLARDITERKRAEKALNDSHDLLRAVVGSTPDAILVKDLRGRYELINSAGARLLGKPAEEMVGKTDAELFAPDAAQAFRERDAQILATGTTETFEESVTTATGTRTYLSTGGPYHDRLGNVVGAVRIARDVTELKRLEAELRQAQKMEAVGRLAGGIAHDFNNLLLVINGYSDMVVSNLAADDPNRDLLYEVQRAGERAAELTRQLLIFSRKQVLQPKVISSTRSSPIFARCSNGSLAKTSN